MGIFSMVLSLLSGVALFLFGMSLMGDGLKQVAGNKLEAFLYKMTNTPLKGVALGTAVTSVIQSSGATTVMVIGFVNSGMMKLRQAIGIIMGANIGTSITGWILCLSYIGEQKNRPPEYRGHHAWICDPHDWYADHERSCRTASRKQSIYGPVNNIFKPSHWYSGRYCIYRHPAECLSNSRCIAGFICNRTAYIFQCISDHPWYRCRSFLPGSDFRDRS